MNGHWLSGTRKLNKHYQSGQGGSSSFVLTGFTVSIHGFEYSGHGERYNQSDSRFYSDDTEKVITAQLYKICDSLPTNYTLENNVHSLYSQWGVTAQSGFYSINNQRRWNATVPVWKYGEFTTEPYWAYDSYYNEIQWLESTVEDININQNGIDRLSLPHFYVKGTARSFENIYNDFEQDIVIPVYEIVAIPNMGGNINGIGVIMTHDGTFNDTYENKITLKGYKRAGIERVACDPISEFFTIIPSDNKIYRYYGYGEIFGLGGGTFYGDVMYRPMLDTSSNAIVAGNYTDPDLGITYEMIYYMRLVRLEKATYNMSTRVLPFNLP